MSLGFATSLILERELYLEIGRSQELLAYLFEPIHKPEIVGVYRLWLKPTGYPISAGSRLKPTQTCREALRFDKLLDIQKRFTDRYFASTPGSHRP
jgi:hypothetical protein